MARFHVGMLLALSGLLLVAMFVCSIPCYGLNDEKGAIFRSENHDLETECRLSNCSSRPMDGALAVSMTLCYNQSLCGETVIARLPLNAADASIDKTCQTAWNTTVSCCLYKGTIHTQCPWGYCPVLGLAVLMMGIVSVVLMGMSLSLVFYRCVEGKPVCTGSV